MLEVFRAAAASCGAPQEVLTDNSEQYVTSRGTSRFARELQQRGVRHIVASPRKPRTLGKIERFWGTLWRECLETAIFVDLEDARRRIGLFIDHYNFQRPHQGISEGRGAQALAPADRFLGAAPQTLAAMRARVAANALSLAREGVPREPFYISGQVGGKPFSLHAEGERIVMIGDDGARREVDLRRPDLPAEVRAAAEASSRGGSGGETETGAGGSSTEETGARGLPPALCAEGIVTTELDDEEEPAPGTGPLDGALRQVESALAPATTPATTSDATPDASRDAPPHAPLPGGPGASDVPGHDAASGIVAGDAPTAREGGER